jgi:hypothetical protein
MSKMRFYYSLLVGDCLKRRHVAFLSQVRFFVEQTLKRLCQISGIVG